MRKLSVIYEEVIKEYSLDDGEPDYELFSRFDDFKMSVLYSFLYENNEDYTMRMSWRVIPYVRLKRIWEQWAIFGFVRDTKGLEMIENIMISNTIKIHVLTQLAGHTTSPTEDDYEDAWGDYVNTYLKQYKLRTQEPDVNNPNQLEFDWNSKNGDGVKKQVNTEELINDPFLDNVMDGLDLPKMNIKQIKKKLIEGLQEQFFWYYIEDPESGHIRMSDYGLEPLIKLMSELRNARDDNSKIVIMDKMLNVVHQRSDIAAWYVKGGSDALSDLSASPSERKKLKNES